MERFIRSCHIFRRVQSLLADRSALAAFPAVSFCVMAAVLLSLIAPAVSLLDLSVSDGRIVCGQCGDRAETDLNVAVFFLILYAVVTLTANFCSAAFYSEIFRCLKGEREASIVRGFRFAAGRLVPLILWSLLSSTVGVILRILSGRNGRSWLFKPLWFAWSVASCFAIPVLVADPALVNPFRALKRSGSVINRTWGEALIGFAGLKVLLWAGFAAWILLLFGLWAGFRAWPDFMSLFFAAACGGTLLFGIFAYMIGAADTVYRATLFLYAEEGIFPDGFDSDDLNGAFIRE
ncbi:MAG: hypothetical protein J5944_14845 [Lentisphaeria bacterium]|nr:hypothetical protein [Lentisphaeria bacterium]